MEGICATAINIFHMKEVKPSFSFLNVLLALLQKFSLQSIESTIVKMFNERKLEMDSSL